VRIAVAVRKKEEEIYAENSEMGKPQKEGKKRSYGTGNIKGMEDTGSWTH
jgi:hypothetical protein